MRGRIIHYNANEGLGLISEGGKQYPFGVADWQSETAPALNTVVEFTISGDRPAAVTRVPDETLLREKAGSLVIRLGLGAGGSRASGGNPADAVARLGRPVLTAHAAFVLGALLLTFVSVHSMSVGRGFTLAGLSKFSDMGAMQVGSPGLVWLAILSPLAPLLLRNRWSWLALLLPLMAIVMPWWDLRSALAGMGQAPGVDAELAAQIAAQLDSMVDFGVGAWVCGGSAVALAAVGLYRALRNVP